MKIQLRQMAIGLGHVPGEPSQVRDIWTLGFSQTDEGSVQLHQAHGQRHGEQIIGEDHATEVPRPLGWLSRNCRKSRKSVTSN